MDERSIVRRITFQIVRVLFDSEILDQMDDQRKLNKFYLNEDEIALFFPVIEDELDVLRPNEFLDNVGTLYDIIGFV